MTLEEKIDIISDKYARDIVMQRKEYPCLPLSKRMELTKFDGYEIAQAFEDGMKYADAHPHWISVKDELPKINPNNSEWEYSDDVIVALKDDSIAVGRYERDNSTGEHYWVLYGEDKDLIVTHWMPLPVQPRGSSEKPSACKKFDMKGYENVVIHEGNAKGCIMKGGEEI